MYADSKNGPAGLIIPQDVVHSGILVLGVLAFIGNTILLIVAPADWIFLVVPALAFIWAYIVYAPAAEGSFRFWPDVVCVIGMCVAFGLGLFLTTLPMWVCAWRMVQTGVFIFIAQSVVFRR